MQMGFLQRFMSTVQLRARAAKNALIVPFVCLSSLKSMQHSTRFPRMHSAQGRKHITLYFFH